MRKLIQIKGANGSGKTTICRQLVGLSKDVTILHKHRKDFNKGRPHATILNDLKWAIVGTYPEGSKGGGCDNINRMDDQMVIVQELLYSYPDHWIVLEGAMVSTTMTHYNFMLELLKPGNTAKGAGSFIPLIVILHTTMDGCLRRMEKRKEIAAGSLTPDMFTQLQPKLDRIPKQKHQPGHTVSMHVDDLDEADMVYEFLALVDWTQP